MTHLPPAEAGPLLAIARSWFARTSRLRPKRQREAAEKLERALVAATALAVRQLGATSPVARRYGELRQAAHDAVLGRANLGALAEPASEALSQVSSALVYLEPRVDTGADAFAAHFAALAPSEGQRWVDLGFGDGASLSNLARLHPGVDFVGVDIEGERTPASVAGASVVLLPRRPDPSELSAVTVERLGAGTAAVVSLLYPLHRRLRDGSGREDLAHVWQLQTALALLAPGGRGLLVTEDAVAWRTAAARLEAEPRADDVRVLPEAVGAAHLRRCGIIPYAPTGRDLGASGGAPPFGWGLVVAFTRR